MYNLSTIVSSDRSSYSDNVILYNVQLLEFSLIDVIDVTSVTLSRLNSINAVDVT